MALSFSTIMDTTQSTSKCGSDFSIERILSSDVNTSNRSENVQVPDWLCCTRYRPPRLPRAVNGGGCRARRSGRHARVPFTASQAAALEAAYARAPYLAPPALRALAAALQLRDDRIKIWFQNRRARERREKCTNIAPPVAVTLPPTTNIQYSFLSTNYPWTRTDISSHTENMHDVISNQERSSFHKTAGYDRDTSLSDNSSICKSSEDEHSDLTLDVEAIED